MFSDWVNYTMFVDGKIVCWNEIKFNLFPHGRNSEQIQALYEDKWSAVSTDGLEGRYAGQVTVKTAAMYMEAVKIYSTKTSEGGVVLYTN